jgi:regulator of CtrA degradation
MPTAMDRFDPPPALHHRLIGPLHVEAMLLADEARAYFDAAGKHERGRLEPVARVAFSCESLKLTTRLMHVIAWLLTQRARQAGELESPPARIPARGLGSAPDTADEVLAMLPDPARVLIDASIDLYRRVERLAGAQEAMAASPARSMFERLSASF